MLPTPLLPAPDTPLLRSHPVPLTAREQALLSALFQHLDAVVALRILEGAIRPNTLIWVFDELARAIALVDPALARRLAPNHAPAAVAAMTGSPFCSAMPNPTKSRIITVALHDQSYRCYEAASRQLQRRLGPVGPTAEELIEFELTHKRSVRSIADDFLDSRRDRGN